MRPPGYEPDELPTALPRDIGLQIYEHYLNFQIYLNYFLKKTDLPGRAIKDFYFKNSKKHLFIHDRFGPKVKMDIEIYFRNQSQMPDIETIAINQASGKILDIGAGAGSHALELQQLNKEVYALEISRSACAVMQDRGVKNVICDDIFKFKNEKFDSLLLLMNGIGLCADLEGFRNFLKHSETLLNEGGKIIFDSCDISYMFEDEPSTAEYFGEFECRYEYEQTFTEWFKWLYIDKYSMQQIADESGWRVKILAEDDSDQYLAELTKK